MVTPDVKRKAVANAPEKLGLSERRACSLIGVARRAVRHEPARPDHAGLRTKLRELAGAPEARDAPGKLRRHSDFNEVCSNCT